MLMAKILHRFCYHRHHHQEEARVLWTSADGAGSSGTGGSEEKTLVAEASVIRGSVVGANVVEGGTDADAENPPAVPLAPPPGGGQRVMTSTDGAGSSDMGG